MAKTLAETKTLIEECVRDTLEEQGILSENLREGVKFRFGSQELDFGSPEHLKILKGLLHGLASLRDCYEIGSAPRHVYASACHRLKRLITKHSPKL